MKTNVIPSTQRIRDLIQRHRPAYIDASGLELRPFCSLTEPAKYIAETMLTDYSNNVKLQYGSTLQGAVNTLLQCKQRKAALVKQLTAEDKSAVDIRRECELQIWGPARRLKETLGTGQP
ncbi:hypothetical protein LPJ54_006050, partial [Coemansia sp. RSA 1824]